MSEPFKQIARIDSTHLGYEDHGMFTVNLTFDFGGSGQGLGHLILAGSKPSAKDEVGIRLLRAIMDACSARTWDEVKGRNVYVLRDGPDEWTAKIVGIEPLPFNKGKRVIFQEVLDGVHADPAD